MANDLLFVAAISPLPDNATWQEWERYLGIPAFPNFELREKVLNHEDELPNFEAREREDSARQRNERLERLRAKMVENTKKFSPIPKPVAMARAPKIHVVIFRAQRQAMGKRHRGR